MRISLPKTYTPTFYLCLFFILSGVAFANAQKTRTITGKVTDGKDALPGVNLHIQGLEGLPTTNTDGTYELTIPAKGDFELIFSSPGFAAVTVKTGARNIINVEMKELPPPKRNFQTYTSQKLDTDALEYSTNILKSIQNRAAGAWVTTSSGTPGAATQVLLRGHRSINGSNTPLIILDGMPVNNLTIGNSTTGTDQSNYLMDISPHDIASAEVVNSFSPRLLKYGMLGRNGAIILKSKLKNSGNGKNNPPKVTFYTRFSGDQVNKLPELQNQYAQGLPFNGNAVYLPPESQNEFSWGPAFSALQRNGIAGAYDRNGSLVPLTSGGQPASPYDPYDFFVPGFTFDTHLSVRGGNDKKQYYFSAGRMQQSGYVPTSSFYRNSLAIGLNQKVSENLTLGGKLYFFNTRGQRAQKGSSGASIPLGVMRTPPSFDNSNGNGTSRQATRNHTTYTILADGGPRSFSRTFIENPYGSVNKNPHSDQVNGQLIQVDLNWKISPQWQFSSQILSDSRIDKRALGFDIQSTSVAGGFFREQNIRNNNLHLNGELNYTTTVWNKLKISTSLGYFQNRQVLSTNSNIATPLRLRGLFTLDNGRQTSSFERSGDRTMRNIYLKTSASYLSGIVLDAGLVRIRHSTVLNGSGITPALGLGIDFAQLFLKESKFFNQLQLRANYSQVSSDADLYTYTQANINISRLRFTSGTTNLDLNTSVATPDLLLNAEMTTTLDFGINVALLNYRLGFQASHYQTTTSDQIIAVNDINIGTLTNGGKIINDGWEFQLSGEVIRTRDFSWTVAANLTRFTSRVSDLPESIARINFGGLSGNTLIYSSAANNQPYGVLYGTYYQRNEAGELVINNHGVPTFGIPGNLGDPTPDWLWGVESKVRWKGLKVSMRWDVRRGGDIWNGTQANLDYYGTSKYSADFRTRGTYIYPGVKLDGTPNDIAVSAYNVNPTSTSFISPLTFYGPANIAEAHLQDASWLRLRELIIAYTLPEALTKGWGMSQLTLSFIGRNLFLATSYTGIDPETNLTGDASGLGIDLFNMPQTKSVGGSVMIRF